MHNHSAAEGLAWRLQTRVKNTLDPFLVFSVVIVLRSASDSCSLATFRVAGSGMSKVDLALHYPVDFLFLRLQIDPSSSGRPEKHCQEVESLATR